MTLSRRSKVLSFDCPQAKRARTFCSFCIIGLVLVVPILGPCSCPCTNCNFLAPHPKVSNLPKIRSSTPSLAFNDLVYFVVSAKKASREARLDVYARRRTLVTREAPSHDSCGRCTWGHSCRKQCLLREEPFLPQIFLVWHMKIKDPEQWWQWPSRAASPSKKVDTVAHSK